MLFLSETEVDALTSLRMESVAMNAAIFSSIILLRIQLEVLIQLKTCAFCVVFIIYLLLVLLAHNRS